MKPSRMAPLRAGYRSTAEAPKMTWGLADLSLYSVIDLLMAVQQTVKLR